MKLLTSIIAFAVIALASAGQVYTGTNYQNQQPRGFTTAEPQYQQTRPQNRPQHIQTGPQQFPARPQRVQPGSQHLPTAHLQARPQYQIRPEYQQARPEQAARIISYNAENDGHNYQYSYETDNGIRAQEAGQSIDKGTQAQGEYSYRGDDGQTYTVTYTADEFGFRPQGEHLPTPPPIPEAIAKALEQNAQDAANGIYDDGSYQQQPIQDYQQYNQQENNYQQNYQQGSNYQQNYQQRSNSQQNYQQGSNYQQSYQQPRTYQQSNYQYQPQVSNTGYHQ